MCSFDSAVAPEFALHHAFVDKLWMDWQLKSTQHLRAHFSQNAADLSGTGGRLVGDVIDNSRLPGGVRVEYEIPHRPHVDKLWMDWQLKSTQHLRAHFSQNAADLSGTGGRLVGDVIDNSRLPGGVRVEYENPHRPHSKGKGWVTYNPTS